MTAMPELIGIFAAALERMRESGEKSRSLPTGRCKGSVRSVTAAWNPPNLDNTGTALPYPLQGKTAVSCSFSEA